MDRFQNIIVILLAVVVLIYLSGGHGMIGHGLGISIAILLIFWLFKGISKKKNNNK